MLNTSTPQYPRARWDLVACGPEGDGPFRLVVYYAHALIIEYFPDLATAFRAIEDAEKAPVSAVVPDKQLIEIPDDQELARQWLTEEAWAVAARH